MNNYSINITPPILWITSWNSILEYVKKNKFDVISDPMGQKSNVDLVVLSLIYVYYSLIFMCLLHFKLNQRLIF
jgi:hypothetical protein